MDILTKIWLKIKKIASFNKKSDSVFCVKKLKISAPKINQKPVQNSEFDVFGFFELIILYINVEIISGVQALSTCLFAEIKDLV